MKCPLYKKLPYPGESCWLVGWLGALNLTSALYPTGALNIPDALYLTGALYLSFEHYISMAHYI